MRNAKNRLFIALIPPEEAILELASAAGMFASISQGREVAIENIHLTLAFLGDQDVEATEEFCTRLSTLKVPAIDWQFDGIEYWGKTRLVVAVDKQAHPNLVPLLKSVRGVITAGQVAVDKRQFRPHITLVRSARPFPLQAFSGVRFRDCELQLMCSERNPEGVRYTPLL